MTFDSSAHYARTPAGEAELALPSKGLSLGQRRVLTWLENPTAADELAQKHHLEPGKLARDLTRLAELRLVESPGTTTTTAPELPAPGRRSHAPVRGSMAPVVIGHGTRRSSAWPLAMGAAGLLLAAGIWYANRARDTVPASTAQPAAPLVKVEATTPVVMPAPPMASAANEAQPAIAAALRGNAHAELRPDIRPALLAVSSRKAPTSETTTKVAPQGLVPNAPPAAPTAAPVTTGIAAPAPGPVAAGVPITMPAAPAAIPASPEPVVAEPPRPVQIAAAAPAPATSRSAVATGLKAISRDPPDFPREAAAEGLKSGMVNARIHVDARGNVTSVDILGAQPPKVFDRAVRKALLRWQFEPIASGTSSELDVDVKFQRE